MAKIKQKIIPLDAKYGFKYDSRQWVLCYLYKNGTNGEESWVSDRYYTSLEELLKKLPDYLLKRSDLTSVEDLLLQCQNIAKRLGSIEDLYLTLKQTEVEAVVD